MCDPREMSETPETGIMSGWLGRIGRPLAEAMLARARGWTFADRQVVYGLGVEQRSIWGIESGAVRVHVSVHEQEPRLCHIAGPGSWFGEISLLTGLPRPLEMEAAGTSRLLSLQYADVERIAAVHADTWQAIALLAALNGRLAITAADDLMIREPRKRLAALLLRLSSHRGAFQGNPPLDAIPATQREIADAAGLSRTITAALLAELAASGAIRTDYRRTLVLDPQMLTSVLTDERVRAPRVGASPVSSPEGESSGASAG